MGVGFLSMTHTEAIALKSSRFSVYTRHAQIHGNGHEYFL